MIRVILVDDHELVLMGIRCFLSDAKDILVVGEANSGEEALLLTRALEPDIVVLDINMPGGGGLEATRRMLRHNPDIKIIVLSICENEPYPSRFIKAGAKGYLPKSCCSEELIRAIYDVYSGKYYLSNRIAQQIVLNGNSKQNTICGRLSERELQIFIFVARGLSAQDIAKKLFLSPKTIFGYRYRIFDKLGINSDVQLTLMAIQLGIIDDAIIDI